MTNSPTQNGFALGVDGCRGGWIAIALGSNGFTPKLAETSQELLELLKVAELTFIDIPIGLSDREASRDCDRLLRKALSPHFSTSVFNPPVRKAIYACSYEDACQQNAVATGKKISKQSWNISPKIRLVDELLIAHPSFRETLLESHPEFLFFNLNGRSSLEYKKKTSEGRKERLQLLAEVLPNALDIFDDVRSQYLKKQMADDDIVDALALAICAQMAIEHGVLSLPQPAERDEKGIPMAIHYVMPN